MSRLGVQRHGMQQVGHVQNWNHPYGCLEEEASRSLPLGLKRTVAQHQREEEVFGGA